VERGEYYSFFWLRLFSSARKMLICSTQHAPRIPVIARQRQILKYELISKFSHSQMAAAELKKSANMRKREANTSHQKTIFSFIAVLITFLLL
jgi:hypothetical protein